MCKPRNISSDTCTRLLSSAPLTIWRTLPRDAIDAQAVPELASVLDRIRYPSRDWKLVVKGQDDAAVRIALAELHAGAGRRSGLLDLAFTGVLLAALLNSPAAALMLAHGLLRVLGPAQGLPLAITWDLVPLLSNGVGLPQVAERADVPTSCRPATLPTLARRGLLRLVVDNASGVTQGDSGDAEGTRA